MRIVAVCLLLAATASAQIWYPNFNSTAGLTLNLNAATSGSVLRVTPSALSQRGAVWHDNLVSVADGFVTEFQFQISSLVSGGGDGFAFVIQADPRLTMAIGNHASALGYGAFLTAPAGTAIANSLAIEFDTWGQAFNGSPEIGANDISIHTGGVGDNSQAEAFSIGAVSLSTATTNMSNGLVHTARIVYVPGTLSVFVDNLVTPVLSVPYSFATGGTHYLASTPVGGLSLLGPNSSLAIVGFTASSGSAYEHHDILNWKFASDDGCKYGSVGVGQGGPYDVLQINGSTGTLHTAFVAANTSFTVDVVQPPNNANPANFLVAGYVGPANTGVNYPLPPVGVLCFPPAFFDPSFFVLAETFPTGLGALLPATPAPWTLPIPTGLPAGVDISLQGLIENVPGVFVTTNAMTLSVR